MRNVFICEFIAIDGGDYQIRWAPTFNFYLLLIIFSFLSLLFYMFFISKGDLLLQMLHQIPIVAILLV